MPRKVTTDIASPTIAEVLDAFLADQEGHLAPRTFARYRDIVDLLRHSLDGYGPNALDDAEEVVFRRHYDAPGDAHREFCEVFGPAHILPHLGEFLGYFMVRKVIAGAETLRAAGTVTKKLATWLAVKGYVAARDAAEGATQGRRAARDLPAADALARALDALAEDDPDVDPAGGLDGHFTVTRIEAGKLWLEELTGEVVGPIAVPDELGRQLRVGWTISGIVSRRGRRWRFAEVWNVYPR